LLRVDVLSDLLGSEDWPGEMQILKPPPSLSCDGISDAGFAVTPLVANDGLAAGMNEILRLRAEIDRPLEAKRRALHLADEWAKEAVELRRRIAELGGRSGGGPETPPLIA
jgi:hypothetical protein